MCLGYPCSHPVSRIRLFPLPDDMNCARIAPWVGHQPILDIMKTIRLITVLIALSAALQGQINITSKADNWSAQTISEIIAYEIMGFDTLNVTIINLPSISTLEGALTKDKTRAHTYTLHLNQALSVKRLIATIAHEFVHIKQYEHEGLEIFGDIWVWNPEGVKEKQDVTWGSMTFTGYEIRGFELDAYEREIGVAKQVLKNLKQTEQLAKVKDLI